MQEIEAASFYANISMAGDIQQAKHICAKFCLKGLCVTVTPTDFIYTGGQETGFVVGLINYPKFPSTPQDITNLAKELAQILIKELFQDSALVQTSDRALWMSKRNR